MAPKNDLQYRILWLLAITAFVMSTISYVRSRPKDVITLKRLDFTQEHDRLVFRLSSPLPNPFVKGEEQLRSSSVYGLQFIDEEGNEMGGLGTIPRMNTGVLCFDHETAEAMCFTKVRDHLQISLFNKPRDGAPAGEAGAARLAIGLEGSGGTSFILLADNEGLPRIKLSVDEDGEPKLEFIDAKGDVIESLPHQ